jgi:hypothetical protein
MKTKHRVWNDRCSRFSVLLPVMTLPAACGGGGVILTSSVNNVDITCH